MTTPSLGKPARIAGWVIHGLIAALMIFAGSGKVFGFAPPEIIDNLKNHGLEDKILLIGIGELATAVLLLIPWTASLGVLLASGFWGGAICFHMAAKESFALPAGLLALTWVGAFLREPAMFQSFLGRR